MKFKNWLLDEARLKGLQRTYQNMFRDPNDKSYSTPPYVVNQMYKSLIYPNFRKDANPWWTSTKNINSPSPVLPSTLAHNDGDDNFNKNVDVTGSQSSRPNNLVSNVINNKNLIKDVNFSKRPMIVELHPLNLERTTLSRLCFVRFGYNPFLADDPERFATHKKLSQERGEKNEPIILIKSDDAYEIIDGYHRAANYLLKGAPPDQVKIVQSGEISELEFDKWKPVRMTAYVGVPNKKYGFAPTDEPPSMQEPEATLIQPHKRTA